MDYNKKKNKSSLYLLTIFYFSRHVALSKRLVKFS